MQISEDENFSFSNSHISYSPILIPSLKSEIFQYFNEDFNNNIEHIIESNNHTNLILNQIFQIIDGSNISQKYKIYYKNLFRKYIQYFSFELPKICLDNINIVLNQKDILFPNNMYYYFKYNLNYKNEHLNRVCFFYIKILRKLKNDYKLDFINIKFYQRELLKKIEIKREKIEKFINFLFKKNEIQNLLIFELIYKFNGHIGGIAKMTVKDISKGFISIYQKNNGLLYFNENKCYKRFKKYIRRNRLKNNDYLFHYGGLKNENKII